MHIWKKQNQTVAYRTMIKPPEVYIRLQFYAQLFFAPCSFHAAFMPDGRLHIFYSVHSVTKFFIYTLHADHVFAALTLPHVYVETVATTYHHRNDSDAFILLKMYVATKQPIQHYRGTVIQYDSELYTVIQNCCGYESLLKCFKTGPIALV